MTPRTCGACGDLYAWPDLAHKCWVLEKDQTQENLPPPAATAYVADRWPDDPEWTYATGADA